VPAGRADDADGPRRQDLIVVTPTRKPDAVQSARKGAMPAGMDVTWVRYRMIAAAS